MERVIKNVGFEELREANEYESGKRSGEFNFTQIRAQLEILIAEDMAARKRNDTIYRGH